MAGKRYKPVNPTGFNCVNVLVQRAIGKVKEKAKNRSRASAWHGANKKRANEGSARRHAKNRDHNLKVMNDNHARNRDTRILQMKKWRDEYGSEYYKDKRQNR